MKAAADIIAEQARALGFAACGFAPAHLGTEARDRLRAFLEAGHQGEMGWLAERSEQRSHPQALWPAARSVVVVGMSYAPAEDALATLSLPDRGNISVYARNRDYHDVIKGRLKHLAQFIVSRLGGEAKVFVDTAPVMEKPLAEEARLGWQGKHTNLVSRDHGSWLLLGEVFTSINIPQSQRQSGSCGTCTRCLSACPTDAFPAPYRLDATRCLSYLTIEHAGPIPLEFRAALGNRIYGCDDCLAVCPWNRFASAASEAKLQARSDLTAPHLAYLATLDDAAFRKLFSGSPIKRIGRNRFVRNVAVAIGNSGDPSLIRAAQSLASDDDPIVAEAAIWALSRLAASVC